MKPYRREEPRETMTHTEPGVNASGRTYDEKNALNAKVDAGLAEAQYEADLAMAGETQKDDQFATVQSVLFHPYLATNVKVLLMQLVWLNRPLTAADLEKGSGLSPLAILHNLKPMIELGALRARFVMVDESNGETVRVFDVVEGIAGKLALVKAPEPVKANG